jgi:TrmH family RNA methyltransferase
MRPAVTITSSHNPRFRAAMALRDARDRRERGEQLVDGAREIGRALAAAVEPVELWVARERVTGAGAVDALALAERSAVPMVEVAPELLARLAFGDRDDGLVLVARAPSTDLAGLQLPQAALVAVVEGVEKPGNLGAIVRSADGAGVDAVILADPRTDPWNPNAVRASLGTVFTVPIARAATEAVVAFLRARGGRIVAARLDGSIDHTLADLNGEVALILGSEAEGLGDAWHGADVTAVRIPMLGVADSLNVSVSAAILFYEALRQRSAQERSRSSGSTT